MSIETDVQLRIADIQTRAANVIATASALEQQVLNQPPPQTDTITIEVGSNSITITNTGITISGPVTFDSAINLPAGSTLNGDEISTGDHYDPDSPPPPPPPPVNS